MLSEKEPLKTARAKGSERDEKENAPELMELEHVKREEHTLTFTQRDTLGADLKKELEKQKQEKEEKKKQMGQITINEHMMTLHAVADTYNTAINFENPLLSKGLTTDAANKLIARHGLNRLKPPKRTSPFIVFLHEFTNPLTALLILCAALSFILYGLDSYHDPTNLYLGGVLIFVCVLNALIDFVQLQKSAAILESFKSFVPQATVLVRDGTQQQWPAEQLTLGDIVCVKEGDKVPADLRIIYAKNFKVDNSSLTGESDPQSRNPDVPKAEVRAVEAENLAFGGSIVVSGEAMGIIIRIGDETVLGKIAGLASGEKRESPLTLEIRRLVKIISIGASIMAIAFFAAGMGINKNFNLNFFFLIGVFVANIPQGLPATVTLLLSLSVKRLSEKKVLVKDLQGVDTLGSITMLASDKTGTMTQNRMTVVHCWINGVHHDSIELPGQKVLSIDSNSTTFNRMVPGSERILQISFMCSKSRFENSEENMKLAIRDRKVLGDATETGLLKFAAHFDEQAVLRGVDDIRVFEVPFNSRNKWALTIVKQSHAEGELLLMMKGAPERVYKRCTGIWDNGVIRPLAEADFPVFEAAYETMAAQGQRVLAFAYSELKGNDFPANFDFQLEPPNYPDNNLVFLGLVGLMDPPKDRVKEAVKACRAAQIQVMMVTGDHPFTAEAIARKVGLITGETIEQAAERLKIPTHDVLDSEYSAVVVHGDKIDSMTNSEWDAVLRKKEIVFARTSPVNKLEIVARCQAKGHIVAVTGDGVNDSPALKKADLGVSMGISGSDISKEVAGMILLDDNFATIVEGIKEGRLIFINLKKSIMYTLTHIFPEILPFLLFIVAGLPVALSSLLILFIDLGTELLPAISISFEPPEGDLMTTPPRKVVSPDDVGLVVNAEEAADLARVPSFVIQKVEIPNAEPKKWWQFWKDDDEDEKDIKTKRKKNKAGEKLVDTPLLLWSYLQAGLLEGIAGFFAFFLVYGAEGIPFASLWGMSREGGPYAVTPPGKYTTPDGATFSGSQMQDFLAEGQSAYFLTIVIVQWFTLYVCKARSEYPIGKRMVANLKTYMSIVPSFLFAIMLAYTPAFNTILASKGPRGITYVPAFVAGTTLVIYEFIRKFFIKSGWCLPFDGICVNLPKTSEEVPKTFLKRSLSIDKGYKSPVAEKKASHDFVVD